MVSVVLGKGRVIVVVGVVGSGVSSDAGVGLVNWSVGIVRVGWDEVMILSITKFLNIVAEVSSESKGSSVNEFVNVTVVVTVEGSTVEVVDSVEIAINTVTEVAIGSEVTIREAVITVLISVVRLVVGAIRMRITISEVAIAMTIRSV